MPKYLSSRVVCAALLTAALAIPAFAQGQQGQRGQRGQNQPAAAPTVPPAPGAQAQPQAGGGRGGGQRGGNQQAAAPAPPSPPTPKRADGSIIMGSVPGQPTGRWSGCCTNISGGKAPYQDWAKAVWDLRGVDQFEPHTRCHASGASRQFSTPYGTELLEMPDLKRIYIMDEGGPHSYRIIYMDGREHPKNLVPSNYGHSIGRWEGQTLVVDTVGYNEKFWVDTRGTPHTKQLHFIERFTRKDFNTMEYQATIDDPGAYTETWTTQVFTMRWTANSDLFEYICQDNNHGPEMMIGSQEEVDRTRLFVP